MSDSVNHPSHYVSDPSGVECIVVAEHRSFCIGNAIKYLWRAGLKGDAIEDLKKSRWYIDREIQRLEKRAAEDTEEHVKKLQKVLLGVGNTAGSP